MQTWCLVTYMYVIGRYYVIQNHNLSEGSE